MILYITLYIPSPGDLFSGDIVGLSFFCDIL